MICPTFLLGACRASYECPRFAGTTITGQAAWCMTLPLTDPSRIYMGVVDAFIELDPDFTPPER
jgi:hypothetical protein